MTSSTLVWQACSMRSWSAAVRRRSGPGAAVDSACSCAQLLPPRRAACAMLSMAGAAEALPGKGGGKGGLRLAAAEHGDIAAAAHCRLCAARTPELAQQLHRHSVRAGVAPRSPRAGSENGRGKVAGARARVAPAGSISQCVVKYSCARVGGALQGPPP